MHTHPAGRSTDLAESRPVIRRRRRAAAQPVTPLGSLTQKEHRIEGACQNCGSTRVTRLTLTMADGLPVDFTSCHRCEERSWERTGDQLSIETVIAQASRKA